MTGVAVRDVVAIAHEGIDGAEGAPLLRRKHHEGVIEIAAAAGHRFGGSVGGKQFRFHASLRECRESPWNGSRDDGYFEIPVPIQQSFQDAAQGAEAFFSCDEAFGFKLAAMNGIQGFPDMARRVMEICLDGNFGIMNEGAVEGNVRAGRAAAEQIDRSSAAHHAHGLLPGFLQSHRFDDDIGAAPAAGHFAHLLHDIGVSGVHDMIRAHGFCHGKLRAAVAQRNDPGSHRFQNLDEHQSYRAHPDDDDGISLFDPGFFDGAEDAGERFDQGRFMEADVVRQNQKVLADDAIRES